MKQTALRKLLKDVGEKYFMPGKPLAKLYPLYDAADTFFFTPDARTSGTTHVRDCVDFKRMMIFVVYALIPCLLMGLYNVGFQANRLIEAGARGGGSNLSAKIVPFMSGINNYEYLIKEALGESVDEEAVKNNVFDEEKYVVMRFFDFGEGIVKRVSGAEILSSHPMMIDYQLKLKPGDILSQPAYGRLRPGHFIIGGIGREKVIAEAEKIINTVKVEFE